MTDDLVKFMFNMKPDPVSSVEVGGLYCLHEENTWLRVEVLESEDLLPTGHFLCKYIDHGEESVHKKDELYPLFDLFRSVPAQVSQNNPTP